MNFQCVWIIRLSVITIFFFVTVFGQQVLTSNDRNVKNVRLDADNLLRMSKSRNVFMGMRGKKTLMDQEHDLQRAPLTSLAGVKRLDGFMAMRGKKMNLLHNSFDEVEDPSIFSDNKRAKGFLGMRGKKEPFDGEVNRWGNSKFFAMRGKRNK